MMKSTEGSTRQDQAVATFPTDLLGCALGFCDGKTISTVLSTAVASNALREKALVMTAAVLKERLALFQMYLLKTPNYMPCLMSPFLAEYLSTIQDECPFHSWQLALRYLSSRLAVLDYFEDAVRYRAQCSGAHEWLVWCGELQLVHYKNESQSIAYFDQSEKIQQTVQVIVTSPCWFPGIVHKWSQGMRQCSVYASDFARRYVRGGHVGINPPTHVARFTPIGRDNASSIYRFNREKRVGDYANPLSPDLLENLILHRLFLAGAQEADRISSRMTCGAGNVKASLCSARTCPNDSLFGFWTDMTQNDRMRNHAEFTADILGTQQMRDRLSQQFNPCQKPAWRANIE